MQVIAHDTFPRVVERLLPRASAWEGPGAMACVGRSEECGPWHSTDTYQAHLASPSASTSLLPVMLNNQSSPHDHNMESESSQAGQRPDCGLRERRVDGRQTSE